MLNSICEAKICVVEFFTLKLSLRVQSAFTDCKVCGSMSGI